MTENIIDVEMAMVPNRCYDKNDISGPCICPGCRIQSTLRFEIRKLQGARSELRGQLAESRPQAYGDCGHEVCKTSNGGWDCPTCLKAEAARYELEAGKFIIKLSLARQSVKNLELMLDALLSEKNKAIDAMKGFTLECIQIAAVKFPKDEQLSAAVKALAESLGCPLIDVVGRIKGIKKDRPA